MKQNILIIIALSIFPMLTTAAVKENKLTILPIGDSITEGKAGSFESYLYPLWEKLYTGGYLVEYIGPRSSPSRMGSLKHFAHGGKNAEYLESKIDSIYRKYPADIVLLHSGHNHFAEEDPVDGIVVAHRSIIDKIRAINPNVIIFDATVINSGKLPKYSYIPELNKRIRKLVKSYHSENVVFVGQTKLFDWKTGTIHDKVHPNKQGASVIADAWYDALSKKISPNATAYNPAILKYKKAQPDDLTLHLFEPQNQAHELRPAIVFFFAGGWQYGSPLQFYRECSYYADKGMVAISVDYRIASYNKTSPMESIEDAKDAVAWIRAHAEEYHINPNKIVVAGASAGGQLAAYLGTIDDGSGRDYKPNLELLYYPVADNSPQGFGPKEMKDKFEEVSPLHNLNESNPPTMFVLGTKDKYVPVLTGKAYVSTLLEKGVYAELHLFERGVHPIFKYREPIGEDYFKIQKITDDFLRRYHYIK